MQVESRQTLNSVQALRGVAASLVLLYHLATTDEKFGLSSFHPLDIFRYVGAQGVDLFFVISGFIIVWTNLDSLGHPERVPRYLVRRILRIFPLYWLFFAFAFVMARVGLSHALDDGTAADPWNILGIFFLLPIKCVHVVPVSWTLTFEFFFYCLFGVMLCFRPRRLPWLLLTWFLLVVLFNGFAPPIDEPTSVLSRVSYVALGLRTIQFMFGAAIALFLKGRTLPMPALWCGAGGLLYAVGGARVAMLERLAHVSDLWRPELIVVFGLGSAGMLAGAVSYERRYGGAFVPRWLISLGDASYALYLSHLFVFAILRRVFSPLNRPSMPAHAAWLIALGACGFAVGLFCYRFLERPVMQRLMGIVAPRRELAKAR